MVIVIVFFMCLFPRLVWSDDVGACWCDGSFSAGGDGWCYPNRICRLGCRFGMQKVISIEVLRVLYM